LTGRLLNVVIDHCDTSAGSASVRTKLARLWARA
jgi:hypothetical protein